jgi:hypothetical protein
MSVFESVSSAAETGIIGLYIGPSLESHVRAGPAVTRTVAAPNPNAMRLIMKTYSALASFTLARAVSIMSDPERRQTNPPMRRLRLVNTGSERPTTGNEGV